jgi:hypothetical protein
VLLAAVVVYASAASDRLPEVVAGVGAGGCLVVALGVVLRQAALVPLGLAGVGASYAVYLALRSGGADSRSPFVAAAVFSAAELAFWSLAAGAGPALRRLGLLAAAAAATVFVGSLLLAFATGSAGGVGLEAAGVAAAVATLLVLAVLAKPKPEL